jgi:hypothetical protein
MKKVDAVLREKELQLDAVRREVEALRTVAPLLIDEAGTIPKIPPQSEHANSPLELNTDLAVKDLKLWP